MSELEKRIEKATQMGLNYGWIDGAHHKMWVIDQMLQILLGDELYNKATEPVEGMVDWDKGIAP